MKRPVATLGATLAASLCLLPGIACRPSAPAGAAPDLAVLAQSAADYEQARPGRPLEFPRDHGAHPGFRIEWWYLTANLQDAEARPYGAQWTLFRFAVRPPGALDAGTPWQSEQVFMAHLAITTPDGHVAFQRYARGGDHGGVAQAGARAQPFAAWLDDWRLESTGDGWLPLALHAGQGAGQDGFAVDLRLDGTGPLVPQGEAGFSQKHPGGGGSHYYSQPFLAASGTLSVDGRAVPVTGHAWLDREWSSQFLQPDQAGWDWFALHLDSGEKLMLFRLRSRSGEGDYLHGVLIGGDGARRALDPSRIRLQAVRETVVAGRALPLHWRIELPEIERSLELQPLHAEQWLELDFPYWEGVVTVSGKGPGSSGRGYLELTGYQP